MVFRKESKVDAFQRQISALRQQLGNDEPPADAPDARYEEPAPEPGRSSFGTSNLRNRETEEFTYAPPASSFSLESYAAEEPSTAVSIPAVDAQTSVVAHDTKWNGELSSSGSLHVLGVVEGSLTARQDVFVAEEAEVSATISATNVIVAGNVKGMIRCSGRFEVLPSGRVTAEVLAPSLVVHEGASMNGRIRMSAEEERAEESEPATAIVHRRLTRNHA